MINITPTASLRPYMDGIVLSIAHRKGSTTYLPVLDEFVTTCDRRQLMHQKTVVSFDVMDG